MPYTVTHRSELIRPCDPDDCCVCVLFLKQRLKHHVRAKCIFGSTSHFLSFVVQVMVKHQDSSRLRDNGGCLIRRVAGMKEGRTALKIRATAIVEINHDGPKGSLAPVGSKVTSIAMWFKIVSWLVAQNSHAFIQTHSRVRRYVQGMI